MNFIQDTNRAVTMPARALSLSNNIIVSTAEGTLSVCDCSEKKQQAHVLSQLVQLVPLQTAVYVR